MFTVSVNRFTNTLYEPVASGLPLLPSIYIIFLFSLPSSSDPATFTSLTFLLSPLLQQMRRAHQTMDLGCSLSRWGEGKQQRRMNKQSRLGGERGGVAKTGVSSRCRKTGWWRVWRLVKNRIFLDSMSHCSQSIQIAYLCCVLIILFNFVLFLSIFTFILNTLFNNLLEKRQKS